MRLDAGPDDYVVKPIRPVELLARVRSLSRRMGAVGADVEIVHGSLLIDAASRVVRVKQQAVRLTATEFEILLCLAQAPNKVFSRVDLLVPRAIGSRGSSKTSARWRSSTMLRSRCIESRLISPRSRGRSSNA